MATDVVLETTMVDEAHTLSYIQLTMDQGLIVVELYVDHAPKVLRSNYA